MVILYVVERLGGSDGGTEYQVGSQFSLCNSAMGKAWLSDCSEDELQDIWVRSTNGNNQQDKPFSHWKELYWEIEGAREIAVTFEHVKEKGLCRFATAIRNTAGEITTTVSIDYKVQRDISELKSAFQLFYEQIYIASGEGKVQLNKDSYIYRYRIIDLRKYLNIWKPLKKK